MVKIVLAHCRDCLKLGDDEPVKMKTNKYRLVRWSCPWHLNHNLVWALMCFSAQHSFTVPPCAYPSTQEKRKTGVLGGGGRDQATTQTTKTHETEIWETFDLTKIPREHQSKHKNTNNSRNSSHQLQRTRKDRDENTKQKKTNMISISQTPAWLTHVLRYKHLDIPVFKPSVLVEKLTILSITPLIALLKERNLLCWLMWLDLRI